MPPITWTERICVLNPRDRRLTISALSSIFFPLKSSLSKRIIVGSENSCLGTKIMFYYLFFIIIWNHVKIILLQGQNTRSGQTRPVTNSVSQEVWEFSYTKAKEREAGGGGGPGEAEFFPYTERQVNINSIIKQGGNILGTKEWLYMPRISTVSVEFIFSFSIFCWDKKGLESHCKQQRPEGPAVPESGGLVGTVLHALSGVWSCCFSCP